jgi:hypothetical protein
MDNTMDININGGNNSMNSLSFYWNAIFKDGTHIFQFDKNGIEHQFREVQEKFNDLVYFNLTNNNGKMFSVNLTNGLIGYNRLEFPYIETEQKKENCRLVFFRRHKVEIGTQDLKEKSHTIEYHLGLQWLKDGKNQKIILIIDEQGNWIIGD